MGRGQYGGSHLVKEVTGPGASLSRYDYDGNLVWTYGLGTDFTVLTPRQQLTPAPYAILAGDAAASNVARLNLPGTSFFSGINTFGNPASTFAGNFMGNGAGLTNVPLPILSTLVLPPQTNYWGDLPTNGLVSSEGGLTPMGR